MSWGNNLWGIKHRWVLSLLAYLLAIVFGICIGEEFISYPWNYLVGFSVLIVSLPLCWFLNGQIIHVGYFFHDRAAK